MLNRGPFRRHTHTRTLKKSLKPLLRVIEGLHDLTHHRLPIDLTTPPTRVVCQPDLTCGQVIAALDSDFGVTLTSRPSRGHDTATLLSSPLPPKLKVM